MSDVYGPVVSQVQIETAVLDLLQTPPPDGDAPRLVYYLAKVERENGLTPRSLGRPSTCRAGVDFNMWRGDESPLVIVVVKPVGTPGKLDPLQYKQVFQIQVGATVKADDEDGARISSSLYGTALMKLLLDNGVFGASPYDPTVNLGSQTEITGYPVPEFAVDDTTSRNIMRAVVTLETLVAPIVTQGGPVDFPSDPYTSPGDWPTVSKVNVTVTAQPLSS